MTLSVALPPSGTPTRARLVTRPLLVRFVSVVGCAVGFYLPLSVVPLFAHAHGAGAAAGLATVALLVATVGFELVTPRLVARVGYRWALGAGLTLLGAPTLLLTVAHSAAAIVAISTVRGAGFAISVVAGGAVTASLIPPERRGEGLAIVGLVGGVPGLIALPAGVWAAARWGFGPVFTVTAVITLLALVSVPGLPARGASAHETHGVVAGLRNRAVTRLACVFATSTAAVGVLVTFLPLALTHRSASVAAAALLAQPTASTITRWVAGRLGDRRGHHRLLAPGLVLGAAGMAMVADTGQGWAVISGAAVFGAGFGILQNSTASLMYAQVPAGAESAVSAIWNAAYDLGMAAGALGAGVLVSTAGYPITFLLTAALALPALALVRRGRGR